MNVDADETKKSNDSQVGRVYDGNITFHRLYNYSKESRQEAQRIG